MEDDLPKRVMRRCEECEQEFSVAATDTKTMTCAPCDFEYSRLKQAAG